MVVHKRIFFWHQVPFDDLIHWELEVEDAINILQKALQMGRKWVFILEWWIQYGKDGASLIELTRFQYINKLPITTDVLYFVKIDDIAYGEVWKRGYPFHLPL